MMRFTDHVVLVTGAGSGIGRAAAQRFAQEGAIVCVADISASGASAVADLISEQGGKAFACTADISLEVDNAGMVAAILERCGRLDVAFLNAGYLGPMPGFEGTDAALFDRQIGINLRGCFLGLKAVHPVIAAGGAVIVTASTAATLGLSETPAYAAAKHGVLGLVRSSASAFAARGARVNALCPGAVSTPMIGGADIELVPSGSLQAPPYRGVGTAQHVAELALFLATPASSFMNGAAVTCDAGLLAASPPFA